MADMTLEEALAAATVDEELVMPVNEVLLINPETRTINVPDSEKMFGVRQDMGVERKYFKCPRIVGDNIDLSQHRIFVNYVPSKQDGTYNLEDDVQGYWCEDLAVDGDFITFSWEISGNVTRSAGYIAFAVYAKTIDENGNLKTKWHTTIAIGNVLETLPDGEEWIAVYPDIVMQLLERMDALEQGGGSGGTPNAVQYVDQTLTQEQQTQARSNIGAASKNEVSKLSEDIAELKENGTGTGNGATTAQANSLWAVLQKTAFSAQLTDAELTAFKTAWGIGGEVEPDIPDEPIEPDNPEVTLSSISAVYSGGDVTAGTAVNDLTGIVVTAHYSDGTSEAVTGYTLSGTIAEGSNTITVSYEGKTTTFTVTGTAESGGDDTAEMMDIVTNFTWTDGIWLNAKGVETANSIYSASPFIPFAAGEVITCTNWKTNNHKASIFCYDADKNFLSSAETAYSVVGVDQYLTAVENTAYIRSTTNTTNLPHAAANGVSFCKMLITAREV